MSAKKGSKVTRDGKTLSIYPHGNGWRFCWREHETAPWRYVTRKTKKAAEEEAWKRLGELAGGGLVWSALDGETRRFLQDVHRLATPADFPAVRAFLESRRKSAEIVASVARFVDHKTAEAGMETRHLGNVRRDLEAMAAAFAGRSVVDVSDAELRRWWDKRVEGRGDKTRNEVRGNLVAFWRWCVWDGLHPKEVTPADKLPRVRGVKSGELHVLTPAGLLRLAEEIEPAWRPWLVLGAFCGLRPEEVAPCQVGARSRRDKRGLRCEEIDWTFRVVRVPGEVSKVKRPRNVPLTEAALEWLAWAGLEQGQTGPVCLVNPTDAGETKRLGKVVFGSGWPQDVLRHSYASYRNAMVRSLPQVAEEMGTSVDILHRHYHNPKTAEEGAAWFSLRPAAIRCHPMKAGSGSASERMPLVVGL